MLWYIQPSFFVSSDGPYCFLVLTTDCNAASPPHGPQKITALKYRLSAGSTFGVRQPLVKQCRGSSVLLEEGVKVQVCAASQRFRAAKVRLTQGASNRLSVLAAASLGIALLTLAPSAKAQVFTWTGGGATANWNDADNWGGVIPTSSNTTSLVFAGTARTTATHNLGAFTLNSLTFALGAGTTSFTVNATTAGNSLTFAGTNPRILH
jgi:hypothetical protein